VALSAGVASSIDQTGGASSRRKKCRGSCVSRLKRSKTSLVAFRSTLQATLRAVLKLMANEETSPRLRVWLANDSYLQLASRRGAGAMFELVMPTAAGDARMRRVVLAVDDDLHTVSKRCAMCTMPMTGCGSRVQRPISHPNRYNSYIYGCLDGRPHGRRERRRSVSRLADIVRDHGCRSYWRRTTGSLSRIGEAKSQGDHTGTVHR
jgi:hypothetical protein